MHLPLVYASIFSTVQKSKNNLHYIITSPWKYTLFALLMNYFISYYAGQIDILHDYPKHGRLSDTNCISICSSQFHISFSFLLKHTHTQEPPTLSSTNIYNIVVIDNSGWHEFKTDNLIGALQQCWIFQSLGYLTLTKILQNLSLYTYCSTLGYDRFRSLYNVELNHCTLHPFDVIVFHFGSNHTAI